MSCRGTQRYQTPGEITARDPAAPDSPVAVLRRPVGRGWRVGRRGSLRSRPRAPGCARARRTGAAPARPDDTGRGKNQSGPATATPQTMAIAATARPQPEPEPAPPLKETSPPPQLSVRYTRSPAPAWVRAWFPPAPAWGRPKSQ